ncbi:MAG: VCBS repeat-containing protein [Candidatus Hydrogenedentes bacterium]|jgi:hypothetical protein|nr:VCBS repeat-containing protein [Candidatus Hydrogenedentota bacterium]
MTVVVVIACVLAAAGEGRAFVLEAGAGVWDVTASDFDGDGIKDILALCSVEDGAAPARLVRLFASTPGGAYPKKPVWTMTLPPDSGALFLAEVDGEPPRELVMTSHRGAEVYRFAGPGFEFSQTVQFASLLPTGSREPVFLRDTATDLDGDGRDEWLVPTALGYEIRTAKGLVAEVTCDVVSEIFGGTSVSITHRLPSYFTFGVPGRQTKALAFLSDRYADFAHGPNWSQRVRFTVPRKLGDSWDASTRMSDVNGDGLPDLVVTQTQGTVNMRVLTQVYLAEAPFEYPEKATADFESKGALSTPYLADVDGDGRLDMVNVAIPFGIRAFANYFVRGKFTVKGSVFLFDGAGFPTKPTFTRSLTLNAPDGREQVSFTLGDFNGDGLLDAAYGSDSDRLSVNLGNKDTFLFSKPWRTFDIPTFGVSRRSKLDDNEREDIVLYHPSTDYRERIDIIVF